MDLQQQARVKVKMAFCLGAWIFIFIGAIMMESMPGEIARLNAIHSPNGLRSALIGLTWGWLAGQWSRS